MEVTSLDRLLIRVRHLLDQLDRLARLDAEVNFFEVPLHEGEDGEDGVVSRS